MSGKVLRDLGIGAGFVVGSFLTGGTLSAILFSAGATFASRGLTRLTLSERHEGVRVNITNTQAALPVVYGTTKIGGKVVDTRQDPNDEKILGRVVAIALGGEDGAGINGVQQVGADGWLAIQSPTFGDHPGHGASQPEILATYADYLTYGLHDGDDAQALDSDLDTRFGADWTSADAGVGIAYLYATLHFDGREDGAFPRGVPEFGFVVDGVNVWDPRSSAWGWSDNPALCILDYLTSERYGAGAFYPERDGGNTALSEIDEASFIAAANHCDELVQDGEGGQKKRFKCNGWVDTGQPTDRNLEELLTSCRGRLVYQGGKYRLVIRGVQTATSFALTEENIVGDWQFVRHGPEKVINGATATFIDKRNLFNPNDISWPEANQSNTFLANDNDYRHAKQIDLPFTTDEVTAQQIIMVELRETRADVTVAVTAKEEALELEVGDVVPITHPTPGWTAKEFWVASVEPVSDATVRLVLEEYDPNTYSLDPQNLRDPPPGTNLPDPRSIAAPTNFTLVSDASTALDTQDGMVIPRIRAQWTAPSNPFLAGYHLRYRVQGTTAWERLPDAAAEDLQAFVTPATKGETYEVDVQAVNSLGVTSDWVGGTIVVDTDPAVIVVYGDLNGTVDPANQVADLTLACFGPDSHFPVTARFYEDNPGSAPFELSSGVTTHEFTASGQSIGPGTYSGLNDREIPQSGIKRFYAKLTDTQGNVWGPFIAPVDLDRIPSLTSVNVGDNGTPTPSIRMTADDDVETIRLYKDKGLAGEKVKTFSGLSGGGIHTFHVGSQASGGDAYDDASYDTDLATGERRSEYEIEIDGNGHTAIVYDVPELKGESADSPNAGLELSINSDTWIVEGPGILKRKYTIGFGPNVQSIGVDWDWFDVVLGAVDNASMTVNVDGSTDSEVVITLTTSFEDGDTNLNVEFLAFSADARGGTLGETLQDLDQDVPSSGAGTGLEIGGSQYTSDYLVAGPGIQFDQDVNDRGRASVVLDGVKVIVSSTEPTESDVIWLKPV